jgi:hypothetical protein
MKLVGGLVEGIIVLIVLFLILDKSQGFSQSVTAFGQVGIGGIKALQGR